MGVKEWNNLHCVGFFRIAVKTHYYVTRGMQLYEYILKTANFIAYRTRQVETMVKRSIAMSCSITLQDGVSLHGFPQDPSLWLEWTRQVQRTRANWPGPTENSLLCSDHFTSDCYEEDTAIAKGFGTEKRVCLKKDAVPTVFPRCSDGDESSSTQSSLPVSSMGEQCSSRKRTCEDVVIPVEKKRAAYEKRERLRVYYV